MQADRIERIYLMTFCKGRFLYDLLQSYGLRRSVLVGDEVDVGLRKHVVALIFKQFFQPIAFCRDVILVINLSFFDKRIG